jgi:hypothetical protein
MNILTGIAMSKPIKAGQIVMFFPLFTLQVLAINGSHKART